MSETDGAMGLWADSPVFAGPEGGPGVYGQGGANSPAAPANATVHVEVYRSIKFFFDENVASNSGGVDELISAQRLEGPISGHDYYTYVHTDQGGELYSDHVTAP